MPNKRIGALGSSSTGKESTFVQKAADREEAVSQSNTSSLGIGIGDGVDVESSVVNKNESGKSNISPFHMAIIIPHSLSSSLVSNKRIGALGSNSTGETISVPELVAKAEMVIEVIPHHMVESIFIEDDSSLDAFQLSPYLLMDLPPNGCFHLLQHDLSMIVQLSMYWYWEERQQRQWKLSS